MREQIDLEVTANIVSLLRAGTDGAIWLVDDAEEALFYQRCAHRSAMVVAAPASAIRVLEMVNDRGIEGVVASVRGAKILQSACGYVFHPSLGDIASLLLTSKSFEEVMTDACGAPWWTACQKVVGSVLQRAVWIARILERLRQLCSSKRLGIDTLLGIVEWGTFEPAWDRVQGILSDAPCAVALDSSLAALKAIARETDLIEALMDCDGRDAVEVLASATRLFRPRGIAALRGVEARELMAGFRLAFDLGEFENDDVFWRMRRWERQNPVFSLLREWRDLDALEVVWNQRYWEKDLESMVRCLAPAETLGVFKMDLDNFKQVNESLSHSAGDEAIRLYCLIVKRLVGRTGYVYRRGGDEVVAFASGVDVEQSRVLAEDVRATIEAEFRAWGAGKGLASFPTASIGVVVSDNTRRPDEIVRMLDHAQQQAKEQGKNRVVLLQ